MDSWIKYQIVSSLPPEPTEMDLINTITDILPDATCDDFIYIADNYCYEQN
jgi:hypothetical protein